jgi:hypothetical protein
LPDGNDASIGVVVSDKSWQELLDRFRQTMKRPNYEHNGLPVVIRNGKIWVVQQHATTLSMDGRFQLFCAMMRRALQVVKRYPQLNPLLPLVNKKRRKQTSIPLLMGLQDYKTCNGNSFPRFGWCSVQDQEENCHNFAVPSFGVYRDAPHQTLGYEHFHHDKERDYPWSTKKPLAVWRGAATGHNPFDWSAIPRAQLVNFSMHHHSHFWTPTLLKPTSFAASNRKNGKSCALFHALVERWPWPIFNDIVPWWISTATRGVIVLEICYA